MCWCDWGHLSLFMFHTAVRNRGINCLCVCVSVLKQKQTEWLFSPLYIKAATTAHAHKTKTLHGLKDTEDTTTTICRIRYVTQAHGHICYLLTVEV